MASAAQQLLAFADLAQAGLFGDGHGHREVELGEAMLEAESAGSLQHLDLPVHLGRCAANLWDRFVEEAQINRGVPGVA